MPAPILFCCTHSTGEAATSLVLAGELARRGVPDLWFAGDENLRERVAELPGPVEFAGTGEVNPDLALTMVDDRTYARIHQRDRVRGLRARARQLSDAGHQVARYRVLDELVGRIEPALMVINRFCFYALQVAMTRGIPYVITAPCLPSDLHADDLPRGYPPPGSGLPLRRTRAQELARLRFLAGVRTLFLDRTVFREAVALHRGMTALGVDPRSARVSEQNARAALRLCFSLPELDYPFDLPDGTRTVGALVPPVRRDPRDADALAWLDGHPSCVFVAFGSITRLTPGQVRDTVEVARRLDGEHRVLWVLPPDQQRFLPPAAELPSNLRVTGWVHSQHAVLDHPHTRAFLTHGGSNSFHESLWFGVPMLVRPTNVDQYDHAVRAGDLGVGLAVRRPDRMDADDVVARLRRLLGEEGFARRARHFGALQHRAGGLDTAAGLLLDQAARCGAGTG